MKALSVAVLAIGLSLLTVLGGAALQTGAWPTGPDAWGFILATAGAGVFLIGALYWPVLARLRRRRSTPLRPGRAAVVTALGLNAPAYLALAIVGGNRSLFAGSEALLIGVALAVMGLSFGAGYASTHREAAV